MPQRDEASFFERLIAEEIKTERGCCEPEVALQQAEDAAEVERVIHVRNSGVQFGAAQQLVIDSHRPPPAPPHKPNTPT